MKDRVPIGPLTCLWIRSGGIPLWLVLILAFLALVAAVVFAFVSGCEREAEGARLAQERRSSSISAPSSAENQAKSGSSAHTRGPGLARLPQVQRTARPATKETSLWRVSAYCPCARCCGKFSDGITASGTRADHPLVAAPPEIPFGTWMQIPGYADGAWVQVEDRGGAIKGRKLDLLFTTHSDALEWGVKWVVVQRREP